MQQKLCHYICTEKSYQYQANGFLQSAQSFKNAKQSRVIYNRNMTPLLKRRTTSQGRTKRKRVVENYEMPVTPVNFLSKNNQFHSNELHCFYTLSSSNKKQRIISLITILFVSFPSRGHLSSKTLAYI